MTLRLIALALMLALPAGAQAASQSSIEGIVTDPSGAIIVGAAVRATNAGTAAVFTATSDPNGLFRFHALPPGDYEVTVEHSGFVAFAQKNIRLTVGLKVALSIHLAVAGHTESVEVSSKPPMIETTRTSVSTTVDSRSISSLPINGRNFLNLILLTPGVASDFFGGFFSFAGQIPMNSLVVDGADHNTFGPGVVGGVDSDRYLFSQEAVQEFQVNSNSYSAELGRAGGAVVNVVTKSGTNDLHGALFWYYRDRGMNATGFMNKLNGEPKDPLHAHQFGGALGGPIVKNRLFFYASYDGQRRSEQNLTFLNLPSGFELDPDPAIAAFEQGALDYLRERSAPYLRTFDQNVSLVKVDWQKSATHQLSGRWNRHRLEAENFASSGYMQSLEHNGPYGQVVDSFTLSVRSALSPSSINTSYFSYVSSSNQWGRNSPYPEATIIESGQLLLQVGGWARGVQENAVKRGEWSDTLFLSRGAHLIKFGSNVMYDAGRFFSSQNFLGNFRFNSLASFGESLAGTPRPQPGDRYIQAFSGTGRPPIDVRPNFVQWAGFIQDEWRVRPSFTLNAGLRYEVQVFTTKALHNAAAALVDRGIDTSFVPTDTNNFAPRVGIAWTPLSSNRLVMRAGFGLYFPRVVANTAGRAYFQNGITAQTRNFRATPADAQWIPAYPNTICGPPDPSGSPPACPAPVSGRDIIMAFGGNYIQAVMQQHNATLEYQIQKDLSVGISYIGVRGTHLQHWQDVNLSGPSAETIGIAQTRIPLPYRRFSPGPINGFDRVSLLLTNSNSIYHGLALTLNRRFADAFQFLASYTFGKAIDDKPTSGSLSIPGGDYALLSDSLDPRLDRGLGDFDQRHRFVASGIWQPHFGGDRAKPAKVLLNGWELSGIFVVGSGMPYSGLVGFDLNNDGNAETDRLPGLGRNTFRSPATFTLDIRLSRDIPLTKWLRLQARCDAFNLLNRVNINYVRDTYYARSTSATECGVPGTPCLVFQSDPITGFGTPILSLDPRILQLSLRVVF